MNLEGFVMFSSQLNGLGFTAADEVVDWKDSKSLRGGMGLGFRARNGICRIASRICVCQVTNADQHALVSVDLGSHWPVYESGALGEGALEVVGIDLFAISSPENRGDMETFQSCQVFTERH